MSVFSGVVKKVIEEQQHQYVHGRKYYEDRVISLSEYFPNRAKGLQRRRNILNEKSGAGKAFSSIPEATRDAARSGRAI